MSNIHRMFFDGAVRACFEEEKRQEQGENYLPVIEGHAIVANVRGITPYFTEEIDRAGITKALQDPNLDVASLWNHDTSKPLGRNPDSLELKEDEIGLFTRTKPTNTSYARDLIENIKAGVVRQMSFGFWPVAEQLDDSGVVPHFIVKEFRLFDISPVTFPFYKQTDLWLKRCEQVMTNRMNQLGKSLSTKHRDYLEYLKKQLEIDKSKLNLF